ncbi:ubiquitin carboxyl-terminal hydrolase 47-like [Leuresthes tenuis]|uniref:ubiquitin carboxyl-terminal hydrolase 47-like n=1 Tax=Leuresthes tenuis TaxID=355514 RepID=UPI003B5126F7
MTEDFREAVKKNAYGDHIDSQLASLFKDLKSRTGETVQVTKKLGIYRVNEQRDAAEHFEKILLLASDEAAKIFKGQLAHNTVCSNCGAKTEEELPFWNLPLALVKSCNKNYSVEDGIEEFFGDSHFTGDNQMYCDECCAKCDATVSCEIKDHPEVLMLLLKRFEFSYVQMSFVKNSRVVDIPPTIQIPENQTYELYAYVEHFGSLKGGHYTATIKPRDEGRWHSFNDSSVTSLHKQPFQKTTNETSQSAYLLFYRKKQTGSPDNREVSNNGSLPCDTNKKHVNKRHGDKHNRPSSEEGIRENKGEKRNEKISQKKRKTDNDDSVAPTNDEQLKKHDSPGGAKDNSSVSFGEQKTQKNKPGHEKETSNRMSTGHEQQGAQNVDEGVKKPPQMGETSATRQHSGEGGQAQEHADRPEEKTAAASKTQNQITVEKQEGSEENRELKNASSSFMFACEEFQM